MTALSDFGVDRSPISLSPLPYPIDETSFAQAGASALERQSASLARILPRHRRRMDMIEAVNASLGFPGLDAEGLDAMEAGRALMPARIALAVANELSVAVTDVVPHAHAMPWLGGQFLPAMAGRDWISIAPRFDDVPLLSLAHGVPEESDATLDDDDVPCSAGVRRSTSPPEASTIRDIIDRIAVKVAARPSGGADSSSDERMQPLSPGDSRNEAEWPEDAGTVLISMTAVPAGVRFVYRGIVSRERMELIEDVLSSQERAFGPSDRLKVEPCIGAGADVRLSCDMMVDAPLAPRLLSALGRPLRRRRGLMDLVLRR